MKKIISSLFIIISSLVLTGCTIDESYDIVTTDFVLYDFVKSVVGNQYTIKLLTPTGVDYHEYEPTSQDLVLISKAKVFFYLGFDYNAYLVNEDTLNEYLSDEAIALDLSTVVEASEHEHDHEDEDEHHHGSHYWTDPEHAIMMIEAIKDTMNAFDGAKAELFENNADIYQTAIEAASNNFIEYLADFELPTIYLVGHNSMNEFAEHFGIEIIALEKSFNPATDLTSEEIQLFISYLRTNDIDFLFMEEGNLERANSIKQISGRDMTILTLYSYHKVFLANVIAGDTYFSLLQENILNIKEALEYEQTVSSDQI